MYKVDLNAKYTRILQLTDISIMAVERDKSRREGILLRMSTRDSVPLNKNFLKKIKGTLFTQQKPITHNATETQTA